MTPGLVKRWSLLTQSKALLFPQLPDLKHMEQHTRFLLALRASGRVKAEPGQDEQGQAPQAEQCQSPFPGRADFLPGTGAGRTNKSFSGNNLLLPPPPRGRR